MRDYTTKVTTAKVMRFGSRPFFFWFRKQIGGN
jgi:hypothetical protein